MTNLSVSTSGLTRRFGSVTAVDGLELNVPTGCVYGFLGPNAAGKTTTIRLLLGLIRPHAGFVQLFGRPMAGDGRALLRRVGALVEAPVSYTHLRAHETPEHPVCRLLLEQKNAPST